MDYFQKINTSIPQNPSLRKHISYYYFMQTTDLAEPFEFSYYPHYYSTLNFFSHAHIELVDGVRHVYSSNKNKHISIYSRNVKTANKSVLKGKVNVIGVLFEPLGFHHFFPDHINIQAEEYIIQHTENGFDEYLNSIFTADSLADKTHLLDNLFESNYQEYEASMIKCALTKIMDCEGDIDLQELCNHLGLNRRTLLRHFKQHLGYTFRDFKAVVKFRLALKQGVQHDNSPGKWGFDHNYYDQSSFIKYFKAKTNDTPKKLLSSLTQVSPQLIWKLP